MTREPTHKADTDESLVDWVIDELGKAFTLERVELLAEAIKIDKEHGCKVFQDEKVLARIRASYNKAKERLKNASRS
mgnify:FL=1